MRFNKSHVFSIVKKQFVLITVMSSVANSVCAADVDSGVWRDSSTKLSWMRCSIGQTWTGNSCDGEAIKLNWNDAMEYPSLFNEDGYAGKKDWRLPTISELSTLRRCSNGWAHNIKTIGNLTKDLGVKMVSIPKGNGTMQVPKYCADGSSSPTLDTNVFPNTTNHASWSSSPVADDSNYAWIVSFGSGGDNYHYKHYYGHVRLVRSGQ